VLTQQLKFKLFEEVISSKVTKIAKAMCKVERLR